MGSGRLDQTATVHLVGENRYLGNVTSGTIYVVVNGNVQTVHLTIGVGVVMREESIQALSPPRASNSFLSGLSERAKDHAVGGRQLRPWA